MRSFAHVLYLHTRARACVCVCLLVCVCVNVCYHNLLPKIQESITIAKR